MHAQAASESTTPVTAHRDAFAYPLQLSANGRYFVDQQNRPFLVAGDSPRALLVSLSEADAGMFLANRQAAGFNSVWIDLYREETAGGRADGSTYDGILPFTTPGDPATRNEAYFSRVDSVLRLAAQSGITVFLDPALTGSRWSGTGRNEAAAIRDYGRYLGTRYRAFDNIVWKSASGKSAGADALQHGIAETDTRHIFTAGIAADAAAPAFAEALRHYNQPRSLPVVMPAPASEFDQSPQALRRQAYQSLLSGAAGQFYENRYTSLFLAGWKSYLETPGSAQMGYLKSLFEPRRWYDLIPDQNHTLVTAGYGTPSGEDYAAAAVTPDGTLAMAYLPSVRTITVDLSKLSAPVTARWYAPGNGSYSLIAGSPFHNTGTGQFTPSADTGDGGDWVLILEAIAPPGGEAPARPVSKRTIRGLPRFARAAGDANAAAPAGMVAAYNFNEGSGSTVADSSGNGITGTINGAAWNNAGKFGKALSFGGSTSLVDLGNPSPLQITGSMTWSAWINASSNPSDDGQIIAKSDGTSGRTGWQFKTTPDTGPHTFGISVSPNGNSLTQRYSRTVRSLNTWYFVAAVYNGSSQSLDIYVNGVLDNGVLSGTIPAAQFNPSINVNIGRRSGGFNFQGLIDEVRIYNRALSQAEILSDMNTPVTADTEPPSAPTGLTATATGTGISVSWTAATDNIAVTGYRVERCQGEGCSTFTQIATAVGTAYNNVGLIARTSYSYRVRAVDGGGNLGPYSNIASVTTHDPAPGDTPTYPLKISSTRRYLIDQNNRPFLMMGDSPQALFVNLSEAEAEMFLADRQASGFNTVWVNLLCNEYTGGRPDGSTYDAVQPFTSQGDLSTPNEAYFSRVDDMIRIAARHGILIFLDPIETGGWLEILHDNGPVKARDYGRFLGARYQGFDNIIWLNGNDFGLWTDQSYDEVVRQVALGLRDNDTRHLQTVELNFWVSSSFDDATWIPLIDLDAAYTYYPTYAEVLQEYSRPNFMPVYMIEANYEFEGNYVDFGYPEVLRRQEYWSLLSGAMGQFYGNRFTWQFIEEWQNNLDTPGSLQFGGFLKELFSTRRWYDLVPDQNHAVVTAGFGTFSSTDTITNNNYATAASTADGALVMVYMPTVRTITVNMAKLSTPPVARWYDPSTGTYLPITGSPFSNTGTQQFTPPGNNGDGDGDWVLLLEAPANPASLVCTQQSLNPAGTSSCTVTLTQLAPLTGTTVSLSSTNPLLSIPASVIVTAGTNVAVFTATAGDIPSDQTANITATLNGVSQSTTLNLVAPMLVSSLACAPNSLGPNAIASCTITLSKVAPPAGITVALSSDNTLLATPASVNVAPGATSIAFNATAAAAIPSDQNATVQATLNGLSKTAVVGLVLPMDFASLACNPGSLVPNAVASCTITLNKAAPPEGTVVALSSDNTLLATPASVTVAPGATSMAFNATAAAVIPGDQNATVQATFNGLSKTAVVGLVLPLQLASLACNPDNLGPGANASCTITLNKAAPPEGTAVALSSDNTLLAAPASVTVAPGTTSMAFNTTAAAIIPSDQNATVQATFNGLSKTAVVGLVLPLQLASLACNPDNLGPGDAISCTIALNKAAPPEGTAVALFSDNVLLAAPASATVPPGVNSVAFNATAAAIPSDQAATLKAEFNGVSKTATVSLISPIVPASLACTPTALGGGTTTSNCAVTLSKIAPPGGTGVFLSSDNAMLAAPSSVMVPAGAVTTSFNATAASIPANSAAVLTATVNGLSRNVILSLVATTAVTSLNCTSTSLAPGASTSCTVTLNRAQTGWTVVQLGRNNTSLSAPSSVLFAAGTTTASFNVTAGAVTTDQAVTLTATFNAASVNTTLNLAAPVLVSSVDCAPNSLGPNATAACTLTLNKAAPAAGSNVTLSSNNALLTASASVNLAAGAISTTFTATAGAIASDQNAILTATLNGVSRTAAVNLVAPAILTSLVCNPGSLGSSATAACTVTLTKAAPPEGALVALSTNNPLLPVPEAVTVSPGASAMAFSTTAGSIPSDQNATITSTLNGVSRTAAINLVAPVTLTSLACTPANLGPGSSSACTVNLSKAAPAGTMVGVSSDNAWLTAPPGVAVTPGLTSTTFHATTGAIPSDQSAVITATLNGVSRTATANLVAPLLISSVVCNPADLAPGASGVCTVTLTKAAPAEGASVALSSNNALLAAPPAVSVGAGLTSTAFNVTAGAIANDQAAIVTATLNGSSRTAAMNLLTPVLVSSLACVPASIGANGASSCTVTVTRAAPAGGTTVALSSNNALLVTSPSVTIGPGLTSAGFSASAGAIPSDQTAAITASLNGSARSVPISLVAPLGVTSLNCVAASLVSGGKSACTVTLSKPAPVSTAVSLTSNTGLLGLPASVTVAAGSSSASFNATAGIVTTDTAAVITASLGAWSQTAPMALSAMPVLLSMNCAPPTLAVGATGSCTLTISNTGAGTATISTSNSALTAPASVAVPSDVTVTTFPVQARTAASGWIIVTASVNGVSKSVLFTIA